MVSVRDIFDSIYSRYSTTELLWFASTISKFHRIQGCEELEEAAEFIRKELLNTRNFEIKIHRFSYGDTYGLHSDIIGWNVKDGFTQLLPRGRILSSFIQSKTAVVAHSPAGDVESEVVYVGDGLDMGRYRGVEDRIILSYGPPYLVYRAGCEHGAAGFIFFRTGAYEKAIPYVGLFLSREDAKICRSPATTISKEDAQRVISRIEKGEKVRARVYVEASYRSEAYAPVIEASIGDGDSEIHMYAHICHPAGTVNDNVSGVASILELIYAVDSCLYKGLLEVPNKKRITFVLFPEYYGSLPYLLGKVKENAQIEFSINLDMIGEKQWVTNSTLHFIRSPQLLSKPSYEALAFKVLAYSLSKNSTFSTVLKTFTYRFDITPYDSGSDHDIYLQFGVPSIMLNQWPDLFYHSDMDTIDKFDPDIAKAVAIAMGTTCYVMSLSRLGSRDVKNLGDAYADFVNSYMKLRALSSGSHADTHTTVEEPTTTYEYTASRGVITTKLIVNRLGLESAFDIMKDLEDRFLYHLATRYIPLLLTLRPLRLYDVANHIALDYGRSIDFTHLKKITAYLEALGVVSKKS